MENTGEGMCLYLFVQSKTQRKRNTGFPIYFSSHSSQSTHLLCLPLLLPAPFLASLTVPCTFLYSYRCLDLTGSFSRDCAQTADSSHLHFATLEKKKKERKSEEGGGKEAAKRMSRQELCVEVRVRAPPCRVACCLALAALLAQALLPCDVLKDVSRSCIWQAPAASDVLNIYVFL